MGDLYKKIWDVHPRDVDIKEGKATWENSSGENIEYEADNNNSSYSISPWDIHHGIYGPISIEQSEPSINSFKILTNENKIKQEVKEHLDSLKEIKIEMDQLSKRFDEEIERFKINFEDLL